MAYKTTGSNLKEAVLHTVSVGMALPASQC